MMFGPLPLAGTYFTCTDCEVGWHESIGEKCWYCDKVSFLREPIVVWWMKQYSQPVWRARVDTHTTGETT